MGTVLTRSATTVNVATSTVAEETFFNYTIPAGTLSTSRTINLHLIGDAYNNVAVNVRMKVKLGGVIIMDDICAPPTTGGTDRFTLEFLVRLTNQGSASAQWTCALVLISGDVPGNPALVGIGTFETSVSAQKWGLLSSDQSTAISTAADTLIEVTTQPNLSDANLSFRRHYAYVEVI